MKITNIHIKLCTLFIALISIYSCDNDNGAEELFDKTPTQRLEEQEREVREALLSSEHGWKAIYFTDSTQLGGWTFLFDFEDDTNVTMISDFSEETLEPRTSEYDILLGSTTKLSFVTGTWIHNLSDSNNYPNADLRGQGYRGDFEFLYYGRDGEDIIFKSNRENILVRFTKASPEDWNNLDEHTELFPLLTQSVYSKLIIDDSDGEEVFDFSFDRATRFTRVNNPQVFDRDISFGVAPTSDTSFTISPGIDVNNTEVTEFTYDEANDRFIGNSPENTSVIITIPNGPSEITNDHQLLGDEITAMAYIYPYLYSSPNSSNFLTLFDEANDALMEDDLYLARIQIEFQANTLEISYRINDLVSEEEVEVTRTTYSANWTVNNESKLVIASNGNWFGNTQYRTLFQDINDMMTTNQGLFVEMSDMNVSFINDILTLTSSEDVSMRIAFYVFTD